MFSIWLYFGFIIACHIVNTRGTVVSSLNDKPQVLSSPNKTLIVHISHSGMQDPGNIAFINKKKVSSAKVSLLDDHKYYTLLLKQSILFAKELWKPLNKHLSPLFSSMFIIRSSGNYIFLYYNQSCSWLIIRNRVANDNINLASVFWA